MLRTTTRYENIQIKGRKEKKEKTQQPVSKSNLGTDLISKQAPSGNT